jgi:hypothetical protein
MRRIIFAIIAAAMTVGLLAPAANATSGDSARRRNAACVTKAEYKKIHRGHTMAQVKRTFGTNGRLSSVENNSYWLWGEYVDDGYWSGDWTYDYETGEYFWDDYAGGYIDNSYWLWGEYVDDGYWSGDWTYDYETGEYFWDDYAGGYIDNSYYTGDTYVSMLDSNRDYKKCRSWNHGRGRVAINFDNYTSAHSGYRVYSKWPNRPWFWSIFNLRTNDTSVLGDKPIETGHEHASNHRTKAEADRIEAAAKAAAKADKPEGAPVK